MNTTVLPPVISRLLAGAALLVAFFVMASVFVPHRIEAQDENYWPKPIDRIDWNDHAKHSTDPHEGLLLLGTLEYSQHVVYIYSTDVGARYSVYAMTPEGESELGVLLSVEQVEQYFPEVPLKNVEFGNGSTQMMLAPPRGGSAWD